jgi:hypothetical protein
MGRFRKPRGRGTSAVGSRYEATASEDCNRLRKFKYVRSVRVLQNQLPFKLLSIVTKIVTIFSGTMLEHISNFKIRIIGNFLPPIGVGLTNPHTRHRERRAREGSITASYSGGLGSNLGLGSSIPN